MGEKKNSLESYQTGGDLIKHGHYEESSQKLLQGHILEGQQVLGGPNMKNVGSKLISSIKRYASKERFMKILDSIAANGMKESMDIENGGDEAARIRDASQWII